MVCKPGRQLENLKVFHSLLPLRFSLYLPSSWSVQVGFVTQQDTQVHPYSVEKIIYHRNYKPKTMGNDIALMKLSATLPLNGNSFCQLSLDFLTLLDKSEKGLLQYRQGNVCWCPVPDPGQLSRSPPPLRAMRDAQCRCSQFAAVRARQRSRFRLPQQKSLGLSIRNSFVLDTQAQRATTWSQGSAKCSQSILVLAY